MKLEVYVMAWWQTQQNIQSLSIPSLWLVNENILYYIWIGKIHYVFDEQS